MLNQRYLSVGNETLFIHSDMLSYFHSSKISVIRSCNINLINKTLKIRKRYMSKVDLPFNHY